MSDGASVVEKKKSEVESCAESKPARASKLRARAVEKIKKLRLSRMPADSARSRWLRYLEKLREEEEAVKPHSLGREERLRWQIVWTSKRLRALKLRSEEKETTDKLKAREEMTKVLEARITVLKRHLFGD